MIGPLLSISHHEIVVLDFVFWITDPTNLSAIGNGEEIFKTGENSLTECMSDNDHCEVNWFTLSLIRTTDLESRYKIRGIS